MELNPESERALSEISDRTKGMQRVAFVSGNFNVVHPGHLRLLRFAAETADFLVVGVHAKHFPGATLPESMRLEGVSSISLVDHAFLLHDTPESFIQRLRPAIVVKGKEHENRYNTEAQIVESYGGKLLFSSGEVRFSSLDLLKRELVETNLTTVNKPREFPARHGFTMADLSKTLEKFKGLNVTVIGDLIVDEYITCDPLGMSQEDPTIVVTPVQNDAFIGGAGIVAAHASGLGANVNFITVAGDDSTAGFALSKLSEYRVETILLKDASRPTSLKQRYRARGKTLLRVSHLRQHDVGQDICREMVRAAQDKLSKSDLVIFSDFNYGCLPQALVDELTAFCQDRKIPMVADSQSSSQMGDISRYRGMQLITPTEREARLAVRDFNSGLVVLAEQLRIKSQARNVIITLGSEGLLIVAPQNRDKISDEMVTDQLPAFNTSPKDPSGAGDSFLTTSSMAYAVGADIWESSYLGSLAAACQVSRVGNLPLTPIDLRAEIDL